MSIMTCKKGFVLAAAICLGLTVTAVRGGSLDAPAAPANPDSAMYTLNDIYNVLNTGTPVPKRTGAFVEPAGEPTNGTMRTLDEIMALAINRPGGTTLATVPKTGQTTSLATGDDGDLERGVAWPVPRFTDHANGTATDNLTGLMWATDGSLVYGTWANCLSTINSLNAGSGIYGHTDWRMPNAKELFSLMSTEQAGLAAGHPFYNTGLWNSFWTSTTVVGNPGNAFAIAIYRGDLGTAAKTDASGMRSFLVRVGN